MRARYSAFARQQVDYLLETVDPRNRHRHKARDLRSWSEGSEWLGLEILSSEGGGPDDKTGSVEFVARYRSEGEEVEHHEVAHFRRESGRWYFVDGKIVGREPIVREAPRVGRNDPCPCGSGKKNKKCCGR